MNNEHGFNIRQIQKALRILYKNGENIPIVYEDGVFGEETERAVIAFQTQNGLEPTGVVNYDTWTKLMESADYYIRKNAEPLPIIPFVSDEKNAVLPNEKGEAVWFLQAMLIVIGEKYSGFDEVFLNGINDKATSDAIIFIHKCASGETCNGELTKVTWNSVAKLFNVIQRS